MKQNTKPVKKITCSQCLNPMQKGVHTEDKGCLENKPVKDVAPMQQKKNSVAETKESETQPVKDWEKEFDDFKVDFFRRRDEYLIAYPNDILMFSNYMWKLIEKLLAKALSQKDRETEKQIDKLAKFIMENIEGEPSQNEGAIDCAIRLLGETK